MATRDGLGILLDTDKDEPWMQDPTQRLNKALEIFKARHPNDDYKNLYEIPNADGSYLFAFAGIHPRKTSPLDGMWPAPDLSYIISLEDCQRKRRA